MVHVAMQNEQIYLLNEQSHTQLAYLLIYYYCDGNFYILHSRRVISVLHEYISPRMWTCPQIYISIPYVSTDPSLSQPSYMYN